MEKRHFVPDAQALLEAKERIEGHAHRTPVLRSRLLDAATGATVFLKAEGFQRGGAFKFRGACNAIFALPQSKLAAGVTTHSSGNHAQAVALAAAARGIRARVVMPNNAPAVKRQAVADYGAEIIDCGPTLADREAKVEEVIAQTGATLIHPYDNPFVIAGQATASMELLEEVPELDVLLAPVGGGGLLSGAALAAHHWAPKVQVIGAEPELANDAAEGLRLGRRLGPNAPVTIADGLRTALSDRTFSILQAHRVPIRTVSEAAIVEAMRFVWQRLNIVIEASSAVPVAVALEGDFKNKKVGIVLSGANVDLDAFFSSLAQ